jgi:hypothetical protein
MGVWECAEGAATIVARSARQTFARAARIFTRSADRSNRCFRTGFPSCRFAAALLAPGTRPIQDRYYWNLLCGQASPGPVVAIRGPPVALENRVKLSAKPPVVNRTSGQAKVGEHGHLQTKEIVCRFREVRNPLRSPRSAVGTRFHARVHVCYWKITDR